jgi:hypothetical protein
LTVSSIRQTIRKVLARPNAHTLSDQEVAERVLEMGDEYDWRDAALELLPDAVWAIRRAEVRKVERAESSRLSAKRKSQPGRKPVWEEELPESTDERRAQATAEGFRTIAEWKEAKREEWFRRADKIWDETMSYITSAVEFTQAFLDSEFALGDGRRVTWGEATREDHMARIEYMRTRIESMDEDVHMHLRVLTVLENAGARTLREARQAEAATPQPSR